MRETEGHKFCVGIDAYKHSCSTCQAEAGAETMRAPETKAVSTKGGGGQNQSAIHSEATQNAEAVPMLAAVPVPEAMSRQEPGSVAV